MDDPMMVRQGPRIGQAALALARVLHPRRGCNRCRGAVGAQTGSGTQAPDEQKKPPAQTFPQRPQLAPSLARKLSHPSAAVSLQLA